MKTPKSLIKSLTVAVAAAVTLSGFVAAGQAHAAHSTYWKAEYKANSALAVISAGVATISNDNHTLQLSNYLRDKPDGKYATMQFRSLIQYDSTGNRAWTQPKNHLTTGNETAPGAYRIKAYPALAGTQYLDVEIRVCQTTQQGVLAGRCTPWVPVDDWAELTAS